MTSPTTSQASPVSGPQKSGRGLGDGRAPKDMGSVIVLSLGLGSRPPLHGFVTRGGLLLSASTTIAQN
jgi:hypothetical protein